MRRPWIESGFEIVNGKAMPTRWTNINENTTIGPSGVEHVLNDQHEKMDRGNFKFDIGDSAWIWTDGKGLAKVWIKDRWSETTWSGTINNFYRFNDPWHNNRKHRGCACHEDHLMLTKKECIRAVKEGMA